MKFAEQFNNGVTFDMNTVGAKYVSLKWLFDNYKESVFVINAMFINTKSIYEPSPVFVSDGICVNIPSHCTPTVDMILHNNEAVQAIKAGQVGFTVYSYVSKNPKAKNKICYSIRYVDIEPDTKVTVIEIPE